MLRPYFKLPQAICLIGRSRKVSNASGLMMGGSSLFLFDSFPTSEDGGIWPLLHAKSRGSLSQCCRPEASTNQQKD